MAQDRMRILDMLAEGKISVDEAERLLSAMASARGSDSMERRADAPRKSPPKYLRVIVEPDAEAGNGEAHERVNIRVPLALVRAGMKLPAMIPPGAARGINEALKEKGIDVDVRTLKADDIEELIDALRDLEIDVQDGNRKVRIYVE
jgi:Fe-S-cluster formation regulator IscX/YfhJ